MALDEWLRSEGIELLDGPEALLGRGERGDVRLGRLRSASDAVVAVKLIEQQHAGRSITLQQPPENPHVVRIFRYCRADSGCLKFAPVYGPSFTTGSQRGSQ